MLARLVEELKKLIPKRPPPLDPREFDDAVALKTEWTPLKAGGTNMRTHGLAVGDDGRHVFRPAFGFLLFCSIFSLMGLGVIALFLFTIKAREAGWIPVLIGALFTGVGVSLIYWAARPVTFDRVSGLCWRGWRDLKKCYERGEECQGTLCRFDQIHALQILSERCTSKNSSYTSYELNLVLEDGSRINILDHGDPVRLRKDAAALGVYLEAPVWDAASDRRTA